jgi:integrase
LRRTEFANLEVRRIRERKGHWVLADFVGKRGRVRTVPLPSATKNALDEWMLSANITSGTVFRRLSKGGQIMPSKLSGWAVWDVVVRSDAAIGIKHLGAHDLRRTCARLCRENGGELEQIQFLLGNAELETTSTVLGQPPGDPIGGQRLDQYIMLIGTPGHLWLSGPAGGVDFSR